MPKRLEGVILAAGESRRMGYPKPLLEVGGRTFIEQIAETMLAVVPRLVIVIGAHRERVRAAIARDVRIAIIENPDYSRGQLSSLKVGLGARNCASRGPSDGPGRNVSSDRRFVQSNGQADCDRAPRWPPGPSGDFRPRVVWRTYVRTARRGRAFRGERGRVAGGLR